MKSGAFFWKMLILKNISRWWKIMKNLLGLIWVRTVWHSDGIPEGFFSKKLILKNISRQPKKIMKNPPACKESNESYWLFKWEGNLKQLLLTSSFNYTINFNPSRKIQDRIVCRETLVWATRNVCEIWFPTMSHFNKCRFRRARQSPVRLRNSKLCSVSSLTIIEYSSD